MTLVDTNVLLDLVTNDARFVEWSIAQLEGAFLRGPIIINDVIYAELSVRYAEVERLDAFVEEAGLQHDPIPREALFLAGKAFRAYRESSGTKTGVLPDFFLGAHAAVLEIPILTRDVARYRTYFPTVELITPNNEGAAH